MLKRSTLHLVFLCFALSTLAQPNSKNGIAAAQIKSSLLGVSFTASNFYMPRGGSNNSNANTQKNNEIAYGASVYYWKGIAPLIDFSTSLNAIFYDYSDVFQANNTGNKVGLELQPTIHFRLLSDDKLWAPFVCTGIGAGVYSGKTGGYFPLGAGSQFNVGNTTYFFLQAQYKWSFNKNIVGNNLFVSIGVAQNLRKSDARKSKSALPMAASATVAADADADGVPDEQDNCPNESGVVALKGCPDSDSDGLADKDDKCPNEKGLSKYNGCPIPDSDNDGMNDEVDNCKDVAGLARYQGCPVPDTDNDGINDEEDGCIDIAGVASNMGCPEIDETVVDRINKAAAKILFGTASNKLLPQAYFALNKVAAILQANPGYKIEINGYTDNQGNAEKNRTLSQARATAVLDYLVQKGIDASRLGATGYGDENPIADNSNAAGRAKNRRVEMKVRNY